jgi:hypothetical protein
MKELLSSYSRKRPILFLALTIALVVVLLLVYYLLIRNPSIQKANAEIMEIPGLVLYYPFTGNADDLSGNNNNGEVHGATLTTDRFGNKNHAYYFDGIDDSITFTLINIPTKSQPRTISAWIKVDSFTPPAPQLPQIGSRATIIGWGHDNVPLQLSAMEIVNGQLTLHTYNYDVMGEIKIELDAWYHMVIVNSGKKTKLSINGIIEEYDSELLDTADLPGRIGAFPDQTGKGLIFPNGYDMSYFHGTIDDICIFNTALTDDQVQILYTVGV